MPCRKSPPIQAGKNAKDGCGGLRKNKNARISTAMGSGMEGFRIGMSFTDPINSEGYRTVDGVSARVLF